MIRQLSFNDISSALQLVQQVFLKFEAPDYSEEGVKTFLEFLKSKEINPLIFYGKYISSSLVGIIAMRGDSHICMFFVDGKYQRQGIGRELFEFAVNKSKSVKITVNSSPFAVKFYHKLGFENTSEEQTQDGIRFTPMIFERK